jgi:GNAT superfamily N-acetyltransferase
MTTQEGFPWLSAAGSCGIRLEESLPGTDTPDRLTAVARDEQGRIIGTLYFGCRLIEGKRTKVVDPEGAQIVAFVVPEHRGQGIASRLFVHEQGYSIGAAGEEQGFEPESGERE